MAMAPRSRLRRAALGLVMTAVVVGSAEEAWAFGAARQGFGIGIGSATIANGISGKFMQGPGAIQAVVGFWGGGGPRHRFGGPDGVAVAADYLFEMPSLARSPYFSIDWSFGLGAGFGVEEFDDHGPGLAVAGIAGLEFNFTVIPFDLTLEYRPSVGLLPGPGLNLIDFTAHLRVWF